MEHKKDDIKDAAPLLNEPFYWPTASLRSMVHDVGPISQETDSIDAEMTVRDMLVSLKNIENQLNSVLTVNAALERDLRNSKEVIADLRAEKAHLEKNIESLKEDIPSKMEIQAEIEHIIDERNIAQCVITGLKSDNEKKSAEVQALQQRISELEGEKIDLLQDISFLELKIGMSIEKLNAYARELSTLKGENIINLEKIRGLEKKHRECLEEKNRLIEKGLDF